MIGAVSVLAWVMVVGFAVSIGPALLSTPASLEPGQIAGLVIVGISYNVGLLLAYAALSIGKVSIVAPITATEGGVAALVSVALGEVLALSTAVVLAVIAVGVVLSAIERPVAEGRAVPRGASSAGSATRVAVLAVAASIAFSVGLVTAGRLGNELPVAWIIVSARAVGVVFVALPLLAMGRLRIVRAAVPLVVFSGVLEALGSGLYVIAAMDGVAAAAVLSSQFAAIAAVAAYFLFGERLQRIQVVGVALIAVGVTALAAFGS